jgi:hypothetical protein
LSRRRPKTWRRPDQPPQINLQSPTTEPPYIFRNRDMCDFFESCTKFFLVCEPAESGKIENIERIDGNLVQELFAIADPITVNKVVEAVVPLAMDDSPQIGQGDACFFRQLQYAVLFVQEGLVHLHVFIYQSLFRGELVSVGLDWRGICILLPGNE